MRKISFLGALLFTALTGWFCNSQDNKHAGKDDTGTDNVKLVPVYLLDSLEHFFGNENWMMLKGMDTSFILFSRQSTPEIKVYQYKLQEGDSINNKESFIRFRGDSLSWKLPDTEWILSGTSPGELRWRKGEDSAVYTYAAPGKIVMEYKGEKTIWIRTITLSDFLVRSRYDWKNGTHFAFDTINFNRLLHEKKGKEDRERKLINTGKN